MKEENVDLDGEMDEPLEKNIEDKLISSVDTLEKKKIDSKRIRIIDDSRKRSTINSVFDERTLFQL
ncbi:MAG: hypothetical protein ACFE8P_12595, partial [Promethearchaeota archaeon]